MSNPVTRFFASRKFAHALGAVGRFMITSGTVILLLVAYQIWGTNLETNKDQKVLKTEFHNELAAASASQTTVDPPTTTTASTTTAPHTTTTGNDGGSLTVGPPATVPPKVASSAIPAPVTGQAIGQISIPSIGLTDFNIVEGTEIAQLKRGAGHYDGTPLPGQLGNAAIAGHRTTYGAPFHNIDKVKPGDLIIIQTLQGTFHYAVTDQVIVKPNEGWVLGTHPVAPDGTGPPSAPAMLTLTACHPKFSAAKRIVTFARLVGTPVPKLRNQDAVAKENQRRAGKAESDPDSGAIDTLSEGPVVRYPGAWWGLGCMALWLIVRLLAWYGHRERKFSRVIPYVLGTPLCLLMLYFFFEAFSYEAFTHALHLNI